MRSALITLATISPAHCWWNQGHMIVAKIAENELSCCHEKIWTRVQEIMELISTRKEKEHAFVESATFADVYNYKMYGAKGKTDPYLDLFNANADLVNTDAHWHYADRPYFTDIDESEAEGAEMAELNIISAI